ncbi:MAG: MarR family winged helix-turn-helix transcriptional regulator [Rickettsiales bacterium]|nr:MarR family winged helix-turn-helix transcriptional regulator [Rickettsiales bacterium]
MGELTTMAALGLWHRVNAQAMKQLKFDLSSRQMAVLFSVYLYAGPHTVKGLSQQFDMSKAAVCRAIDALCVMDLVKRKKDMDDKRNVFIQRTINGSVFLSDYADIIMKQTTKSNEDIVPLTVART